MKSMKISIFRKCTNREQIKTEVNGNEQLIHSRTKRKNEILTLGFVGAVASRAVGLAVAHEAAVDAQVRRRQAAAVPRHAHAVHGPRAREALLPAAVAWRGGWREVIAVEGHADAWMIF